MTELSDGARSLIIRAGGGSLFGDVVPLLANMNAASPIPTELLPDLLLGILNDWWGMPTRWAVLLAMRLEQANAAIIAQHKEAAAAYESRRPRRPRGMDKRQRTHKAGRR